MTQQFIEGSSSEPVNTFEEAKRVQFRMTHPFRGGSALEHVILAAHDSWLYFHGFPAVVGEDWSLDKCVSVNIDAFNLEDDLRQNPVVIAYCKEQDYVERDGFRICSPGEQAARLKQFRYRQDHPRTNRVYASYHDEYCCPLHGCMYEDADCPVVAGHEDGVPCKEQEMIESGRYGLVKIKPPLPDNEGVIHVEEQDRKEEAQEPKFAPYNDLDEPYLRAALARQGFRL